MMDFAQATYLIGIALGFWLGWMLRGDFDRFRAAAGKGS